MAAVAPLVVRVSRAASAGALARGGGARFELGVDSGAWRRVDNPYRIAHYRAFSTERIERLGATL